MIVPTKHNPSVFDTIACQLIAATSRPVAIACGPSKKMKIALLGSHFEKGLSTKFQTFNPKSCVTE